MPLGIPPTSDQLRPIGEAGGDRRLNASRHSSDVGPWTPQIRRTSAYRVSMPLGIPPTSDRQWREASSRPRGVSMPLGIPPTSDRTIWPTRRAATRVSQCLSAFLRRRTPSKARFESSKSKSQCLSAFLRRRTTTEPVNSALTTCLNASRHSSDVGPNNNPDSRAGGTRLNASRHSSDVGPAIIVVGVIAAHLSQCLSAFLRRRTTRVFRGADAAASLNASRHSSDVGPLCEEDFADDWLRLNASRHSSDVGPCLRPSGQITPPRSQCLSAFLRRRTPATVGHVRPGACRLNASRHSSDVGPRPSTIYYR